MEARRRRVALIVGRFQPFHNGHAALLAHAMADGPAIVGIGSSQEGRTRDNPFTFKERKEMIQGVANVPVVAIPDINDPPNWVAHVQSLVDFDIVYGNDAATTDLFVAAGIPVVQPGLQMRQEWQGSHIRKWINWQGSVPKAVVPIIETYLHQLNI